jgi:ribosomal protein L16 Arg81 hydroxylase
MANLPSTAESPDLDWSQVRETMTMLALAIAQIRCTMTDGENSVNTLSTLFTQMAEHMQSIQNIASNKSCGEDELAEIQQRSSESTQHIYQAITSFQFYDRVSQRLDHVAHSLDQLTSLIASPELLYNPHSWKAVQDEIRESYSMECERLMFEHIMRGATIEQALQVYQHHFEETAGPSYDTDDEIELF